MNKEVFKKGSKKKSENMSAIVIRNFENWNFFGPILKNF